MIKTAKTVQEGKRLSRVCQAGKLRRIYHGIYTDDLTSDIKEIVIKNWMQVLPHIVTHGILGFKTALELKPQRLNGKAIIFVISSYVKTIHLPGLTIKVYKGNHTQFIEQILIHLFRSNLPRTLLENLSTIRKKKYVGIKTIGIEGVETLLAQALHRQGEHHLRRIRNEAKQIAEVLGYHHEYRKLYQMISTLLSPCSDDNRLSSHYAQAVAQKKPYDENRAQLFDELVLFLKKCHFLQRIYQYHASSFKNLSFYESYFSNFIEGTEFMIDEAEDIVFKGMEISHRHADSHDVLSHFVVTHDYTEMSIIPHHLNEFLEILRRRHAILMKERPENRPGEFKIKPNKAGNTFFVLPQDVLGTLWQGFERYQLLQPGLEKALFMQFLISEIHPFDDGNGRLSRIMMNAELVYHAHYKIMIPNVHRDNYLNGLRLASRDRNFRIYVKVMDQAHAYTSSVDWLDYGQAREKLEQDHATLPPEEGVPVFNRVLRTLKLSDIPTS